MRTTTSINFYCRPSKKDRNGQAPIEMSIIINGQRTYLQTNAKCDPKIYNSRKCPVEITQFTENLRNNLVSTLADMTLKRIPITAQKVKELLRTGGVKTYTLTTLYADFNRLLDAKVKAGKLSLIVSKRYKKVQQDFLNLVGDKETQTITPNDIQTFHIGLLAKYEESSIAGMMTRLKTIIKYAIDNDKCHTNPFQGTKISKGVKEITTITPQDLQTICSKTFVNRCQKVADLFVFSCGSGISYIDCLDLNKGDFQDHNGHLCIFKHRHKTKIPYYSVLLPWAIEIAKKYDYDFTQLKISNQKVNAYLKEIQDICGITSVQSLHFHLARHFYATYLIQNNIPISTISKALGHSNNSSITQHYARLLPTTIVSEIGTLT